MLVSPGLLQGAVQTEPALITFFNPNLISNRRDILTSVGFVCLFFRGSRTQRRVECDGAQPALRICAFCIQGVNQLYIQSMARNPWMGRASRLHHSMPFHTGDLSVRGGPGTNSLQIRGPAVSLWTLQGGQSATFGSYSPVTCSQSSPMIQGFFPAQPPPTNPTYFRTWWFGTPSPLSTAWLFILLELLVRTQSSSQIHYASFRLRLLHRITVAFVTTGTQEISVLRASEIMSESVFLTTSRIILPVFLLIFENYE